ncbi:hypothetical protein [Peribacillus frigoritolerans]|nr:hypothetical protein [Peribacillus frigoritolerans]
METVQSNEIKLSQDKAYWMYKKMLEIRKTDWGLKNGNGSIE